MPTLTLTDLTLEYERGGYVVRPIDGLDLQVGDGELALLVGASGCGKTTLLSALATLLTPARGSIVLDETEVTALTGKARDEYRRRGVGVAFQASTSCPHSAPSTTSPCRCGTTGCRVGRRAREPESC
jgi:putative ABC transport system ATP-binding protein